MLLQSFSDCWNFCNGEEIQCCEFDDICAITCNGDLVAGCLEQQPTPEPTPSPTDAQCLVSVNTGFCGPLVKDQTPVEECGCYNYCNSQFIGCCPYGEFCPLMCSGSLVAGCELDDEEPEPVCLVSVNKNSCSPLMRVTEPVEDCGKQFLLRHLWVWNCDSLKTCHLTNFCPHIDIVGLVAKIVTTFAMVSL